MRIGYHISVAGGLVKAARKAHAIGCECLQIFPRNSRGWGSRRYPDAEVAAFRAEREQYDLRPLVLHSNYLVNLASPDRKLLAISRRVVADDLQRAALLGAAFVVTHPGHAVGENVETGLARLAESVALLLPQVPTGARFLLENTAGGDAQLGGRWEHFAHVLAQVNGDSRLGICFDTCHAHAAGYRLDTTRRVGATLREFTRVVGLDRLAMLHLNDCQSPPGGHRDRHEHIGKGTIGDRGIQALLRRKELRDRCAILETPIRQKEDDARNIAHVWALLGREARAGNAVEQAEVETRSGTDGQRRIRSRRDPPAG